MQRIIGRDKTFLVIIGERLLPSALKLPEVVDLRWCSPPGGQPGGLRLQHGANSEEFIGLGVSGHVNKRA